MGLHGDQCIQSTCAFVLTRAPLSKVLNNCRKRAGSLYCTTLLTWCSLAFRAWTSRIPLQEMISSKSVEYEVCTHPWKCSWVSCVALDRNASWKSSAMPIDHSSARSSHTIPASTQTAFNCAPFMSSVDLASSSKLARVSATP
jgi:hypothetical protein